MRIHKPEDMEGHPAPVQPVLLLRGWRKGTEVLLGASLKSSWTNVAADNARGRMKLSYSRWLYVCMYSHRLRENIWTVCEPASLACLSVTCAVFAMFLINSLPLYLVLWNLDDMRQHREMQNTNNMSSDEYYSNLLSWHEWNFVILVNAAITILSNLQTVVEQRCIHGVGFLHVSQQVATGETLLQVAVPTCASVKHSHVLLNEIATFSQERQSWGHEKYLCK